MKKVSVLYRVFTKCKCKISRRMLRGLYNILVSEHWMGVMFGVGEEYINIMVVT